MNYRRLGNSGLKVSEIGLGGWLTFDHADSEALGQTVIDEGMDCGVNFFDTANAYAQGGCETLWGSLLQRYRRDSYVLATKVYFPMGDGPNDRGLSRKHIMEQCDASLKRLNTDYIDLYQCHRYDDETPVEETIRAMDDLVHQGKILYWGFSWWPPARIKQAMDICQNGYYAPISSQPKYNLLNRDIEAEVLPLCSDNGIGQVVFCPLEQGLLTGKYLPGAALPSGSRAANEEQNQFMKDLVNNQAILQAIANLKGVAEDAKCSLSQLSLAWILTKADISSCITGATAASQVRENCAASKVVLGGDQIQRIQAIMDPVVYSDHP